MARAEIKEWTTRCLLVLPLQFVVTGFLVERVADALTRDPGAAAAILVLGLAALVVLARLSQYCTDAVATGESYLAKCHPAFWSKYKVCQFSESGFLACYHQVYFVVLAFAVIRHVRGQPTIFHTALLGSVVLGVAMFLWTRGIRQESNWTTQHADTVDDYGDTLLKCLRDEILAWQTRRFALLTAVVAMIPFALKAWTSSLLDSYSPALLVLCVVAGSYRLTYNADKLAGNASEVLQPMLHWEYAINESNKRRTYLPFRLRFNTLVLGCYAVLAAAAAVFSACQFAH
jgi:hypothetical protein